MAEDESTISPCPAPRANPHLEGHGAAEQILLAAYASGRMAHAWLISGPHGVGKATLAFRFARFLFAQSGGGCNGSTVDASHPVFHRVASGGHADLLTVEKQFDEEKGKLRKDIAVENVRRIAPFLHLTPAEGGWRVVIVDGAEGMNRAGQNALLKILEEPPQRAVLLLLTDRPASMLPTIRSRCRQLAIPLLDDDVVDRLLVRYRPDLSPGLRAGLVAVGGGSIGRALDIARYDALSMLMQFLAIAAKEPIDWSAAHAFGERISSVALDDTFHAFVSLLVDWLSRIVRELGRNGGQPPSNRERQIEGEQALIERLARNARLEPLLEVWEKVTLLFARSDSANLDKRLTVLSAFAVLNTALR